MKEDYKFSPEEIPVGEQRQESVSERYTEASSYEFGGKEAEQLKNDIKNKRNEIYKLEKKTPGKAILFIGLILSCVLVLALVSILVRGNTNELFWALCFLTGPLFIYLYFRQVKLHRKKLEKAQNELSELDRQLHNINPIMEEI